MRFHRAPYLDKLRVYMNRSAHNIQAALQVVAQLRQQHLADAPLAGASAQIKRYQAQRFQASYADLLQSPRYKTAATFFYTSYTATMTMPSETSSLRGLPTRLPSCFRSR
jgi:hypothetical protein